MRASAGRALRPADAARPESLRNRGACLSTIPDELVASARSRVRDEFRNWLQLGLEARERA
jgi:hypothetical protein